MSASEIKLTAEDRQELIDELSWREGAKKKEIIEDIKRAREFGDLSENAEYDAAREEQSVNEARIAEIRATLANAVIVEAGQAEGELTVSIGCTVTLVDGEGEATDFKLVGTTQTNSLERKISNESPVGRAVIGQREGETVEVVMPSGKTRIYTIAKIKR